MNKKNKPRKRDSGGGSKPTRDKGFPIVAVVVPVLAIALILGIWLTRPRPAVPTPTAAAVPGTNSSATTSAAHEKPAPDSRFKALVGRWLRPDGGYVLEIRSVDDLGVMEAAYFNPNPIHVEKAVALREGAVAKVYIVLRGVNYPGSTYTLVYDSASDTLQGNYFQALQGQNFDVVFQRTK